jgi:hypothetical protein
MHAAFGIWAAVVAIIVIFVPNVVCLALAMWLYDIQVRRFKRAQITELAELQPRLSRRMPLVEQRLYQIIDERMEKISRVPNLPFKRNTIYSLISVSLIPVAGAVVAALRKFCN